MFVVTANQMRALDRLTIERYGIAGFELMQRAGAGATEMLLERFPFVHGQRVVIVAGKGNNGGDGFVVGRLLLQAGVQAEVVLLARADEVGGDAALALAAYRADGGTLIEAVDAAGLFALGQHLEGAALVVDALLGTGLNAPVRGLQADAIYTINACGKPVLAIDLPSGLDADRGVPLGVAVQAEATATFAFPKLGQVVYPGLDYVGELAVVDIGVPAEAVAEVGVRIHLLERADAVNLLPQRVAEAHKGTCGHVLLLAGSLGHTGAALLAARAAARGGAGLVTHAGPASLNTIFCLGAPEVMTAPLADVAGQLQFTSAAARQVLRGKHTVVIGPGLGTHTAVERWLRCVLGQRQLPVVIDADGLTCLARDLSLLAGRSVPAVLTPHPGEMARLTGTSTADVQSDRVATARDFAVQHGCVLVLKGARTVIAAPDGSVWINPTGNPGMATGGMGDVLAGVIGALLAQGMAPSAAARLGVYVHGAVADSIAELQGQIGMLASDIIDGLPQAWGDLVTP